MVEMPDAAQEQDEFVQGRKNFLQTGYRAMTVVPMVRDGAAIGTISVVRAAPGPLSDRQQAMLRTFADQALIAIENVRRFNETKESLERQTATGEILRVIASSPSDVQPVFDAIVSSSKRLLGGSSGSMVLVVEDQLRLAAQTSISPEVDEENRRLYP